MTALTDAEIGQLSRHLSGDAFDVQPVIPDSDGIMQTIRDLPGLRQFLEKEGHLVAARRVQRLRRVGRLRERTTLSPAKNREGGGKPAAGPTGHAVQLGWRIANSRRLFCSFFVEPLSEIL